METTTIRETIAAIATPSGRGAVAIVRVSGEGALAVGERLCRRAMVPGRIRCLAVFDADGRRLDTAVVLAFRAPASYTGEDTVESQCHGGTVTPRRILRAALAAGARLARRGEFTERAFLNGRLALDQAEAVIDLIDAKTERAADAALAGLDGASAREVRACYDAALALSSELEHALDIDDGELPDGFETGLRERAAALAQEARRAARRLGAAALLRDGAMVVLSGPPNVGKSSLMNALLGRDRAIVSDVAGTTRDSIEDWMDLDGIPVRLVDTAGLRETGDAIEREGVRRARDLAAAADVAVVLDDGRGAEATVVAQRRIRVRSKCDLGRASDALNVSVRTGEGLDALRQALVAAVREIEPQSDGGCNERHRAALLAAAVALDAATTAPDLVLAGNAVRGAAETLGRDIGAEYSDDLLERIFSRFCVGK